MHMDLAIPLTIMELFTATMEQPYGFRMSALLVQIMIEIRL